MAAATTAVLGLGMSAYQMVDGISREKKNQRALDDYERQELDNAFKEIQISTYGADLLREENARTSAGLIDSARQGGSRSIIGGIPRIVGATNQINQEAGRLIDGQVVNREYAIAGDNARIEGITENRDNQNINALSSQVQAGRQDFMSGMMGAASAAAYGAENIDFGGTSNDGLQGSWNERRAQRTAKSGAGTTTASNVQPAPVVSSASSINTPYSIPNVFFNESLFGNQLRREDMVTNQINF